MENFPKSTKSATTGLSAFGKKVMPHNTMGNLNRLLQVIKHPTRPAKGRSGKQ